MQGALPKAKVEDKNAMPPVNRRNAATPKQFEGVLKATEHAEYGDYTETTEKMDQQWKESIGRRMSELKSVEKPPVDVVKGKDSKDVPQKKKVSIGMAPPEAGKEKSVIIAPPTATATAVTPRSAAAPSVAKKPPGPRRPPGCELIDSSVD